MSLWFWYSRFIQAVLGMLAHAFFKIKDWYPIRTCHGFLSFWTFLSASVTCHSFPWAPDGLDDWVSFWPLGPGSEHSLWIASATKTSLVNLWMLWPSLTTRQQWQIIYPQSSDSRRQQFQPKAVFALGARLSMFQSDGKDHLQESSVWLHGWSTRRSVPIIGSKLSSAIAKLWCKPSATLDLHLAIHLLRTIIGTAFQPANDNEQ